MRCYLVQAPGAKRYAGTNALSITARNELVDKLGLRKKDVAITEVDVPMAKAELLSFINTLCVELDDRPSQ